MLSKRILQIYLNSPTYSLLLLIWSDIFFSYSCFPSKCFLEIETGCDFFFFLLRFPIVDLVSSIFSRRPSICFRYPSFYSSRDSIESGSYLEESKPKSLNTNFTFFYRSILWSSFYSLFFFSFIFSFSFVLSPNIEEGAGSKVAYSCWKLRLETLFLMYKSSVLFKTTLRVSTSFSIFASFFIFVTILCSSFPAEDSYLLNYSILWRYSCSPTVPSITRTL